MKITENNTVFNRYRGMIFLSKSNLKVLFSANSKVYNSWNSILLTLQSRRETNYVLSLLSACLIIAFFESKLGQGVRGMHRGLAAP